jgi:hypothetical protein
VDASTSRAEFDCSLKTKRLYIATDDTCSFASE